MPPYKCPICEGQGHVASEGHKRKARCHACKGLGVLWPPRDYYENPVTSLPVQKYPWDNTFRWVYR